jgi:hypothetical protein
MDIDKLNQYRTDANINNIRYELAKSADNISKCGDFLIDYANEIIKVAEDLKRYSKKIEDNVEKINNDKKVSDAAVFVTATKTPPNIPRLLINLKDPDIYKTESLKYLYSYSENYKHELSDLISSINMIEKR